MDWMNVVEDVVQRYTGQGGGTAAAPDNPHEDFQKVAQAAPQNVVAGGITQAFRSDQTPPFPEMLANLFSHSDASQQAGLLNRLLGSVGPGLIADMAARSGLPSELAGGSVTPDQASRISPGQVQQMAAQAERQNPSVVDELGSFYAQHPDVVKALGGMALTIAMQHMMKERERR
jgi:hypothetical protein